MSVQFLVFNSMTYILPKARRTVLEHIEGDIKPGAITALIGANGAGKSTLIQAIMGELRPISGEVICTVEKARLAWLTTATRAGPYLSDERGRAGDDRQLA